MTEQEAEEFARRLERIWGVEHIEVGLTRKQKLKLTGDINARVAFELSEVPPTWSFTLFFRDTQGNLLGRLNYITEVRVTTSFALTEDTEEYDRVAEQWFEVFRCNCWLSGADIEATAHEKAEWLQGFTREEIDAWNLKM